MEFANESLLEAVNNCDIKSVQSIVANISAEELLQIVGTSDSPLLVRMANNNQLELLQEFARKLGREQFVQIRDATGASLLHHCVRDDQVPLVEFLLQTGIDLLARDEAQRTALHLAAQQASYAVVKRLVKANNDLEHVDARDAEGNNPLMAACSVTGDVGTLYLAFKTVRYILRHSLLTLDEFGSGGLSALHKAVVAENVELVRYILWQQVDPNSRVSNKHDTPLYFLSLKCRAEPLEGARLEIAQLLVDFGAHLNYKVATEDGRSLQRACFLNTPARSTLIEYQQQLQQKAEAEKKLLVDAHRTRKVVEKKMLDMRSPQKAVLAAGFAKNPPAHSAGIDELSQVFWIKYPGFHIWPARVSFIFLCSPLPICAAELYLHTSFR